VNRSETLWQDGADSYGRTVQLPGDDSPEANGAGAALVERIRALAAESFPAIRGYSLDLEAPAAGEASGKVALRDFQAGFRASAGQDRRYSGGGQFRTCRTVSFEAEARILSLGRAEQTYVWVGIVIGLAGAVGGAALFFFLRHLVLKALGAIVYPAAAPFAFAGAGAFLGAFVGHLIGKFVAGRLGARTARDESVVGAAGDWDAFVSGVSRLMDGIEETT
jgi:hypothetical protein